jgi:hypothetical protein
VKRSGGKSVYFAEKVGKIAEIVDKNAEGNGEFFGCGRFFGCLKN